MRKSSTRNSAIIGTMIKGMAAGLVGVWAMDGLTKYMWRHESPVALARERLARPGGLDPAHAMANRMATAMGRKLEPAQPHPAGVAVHYALGIVPAVLYAVMRGRLPAWGLGRGMLFGLAVFLLHDELINSVTRFSGKPNDYPWQAHVRGLVGHVAYGGAAEAALRAVENRPH